MLSSAPLSSPAADGELLSRWSTAVLRILNPQESGACLWQGLARSDNNNWSIAMLCLPFPGFLYALEFNNNGINANAFQLKHGTVDIESSSLTSFLAPDTPLSSWVVRCFLEPSGVAALRNILHQLENAVAVECADDCKATMDRVKYYLSGL